MLRLEIRKELPGFRLRLRLEAGERGVVLFGPSGAGKSLTLQCIAGLATPNAGRIQIGERVLFDSEARVNLPVRDRRIGYVFQSHALFPHLTVAQNVAFGLNRVPQKERAARVAEILSMVRLE